MSRPPVELIALAALRAIDVMDSDPRIIAEHTNVALAWEVLNRAGCPFPAVRKGARIVGVIDKRVLAVGGRPPPGRESRAASLPEPPSSMTVRPNTALIEVVLAVRQSPTAVTFVVDHDGRLLGVITTAHLAALIDAASERDVSPRARRAPVAR